MKLQRRYSRIRNLPAVLVLLAVLMLSACTPAFSTPAITDDSIEVPSTAAVEAATPEAGITAPLPVATSRGPNLEATDPSTVSLASGQLQLVEFFRFT